MRSAMIGGCDVVGVHGGVSRGELLARGFSPDAIKHQLARGKLVQIHRGVYAVGGAPLSAHGRIRAALLAAGARSAASHSTAAFLDHLIPTLPAVLHVTILGSRRRSRRGLFVHRTERSFERRIVNGLASTSTLRTLEDLGWPDRPIGEALARRLIRPDDVPAGHEAIPAQSELEKRMRRLCRQAGLPQPLCQHQIGGHRVDFAWPAQRLSSRPTAMPRTGRATRSRPTARGTPTSLLRAGS
jgi:hypothetical protein